MNRWHALLLITCVWLAGCSQSNDMEEYSDNEYATGFSIEQISDDIRKLTISGTDFYLIPRGVDLPDTLAKNQVIFTPVQRMVCTSTSHIPLLDYLDEEASLVGFPTPDYISSLDIRTRIDAGHVTDVGIDQSVNTELIITLEPDVVMGYAIGTNSALGKLSDMGIPVLLNTEFMERHPLGRAEWIRVAGWLFNKEKVADSIFNHIKVQYQTLQSSVSGVTNRPTVFSGVMYGDTWFLPGGKNNMSRLFEDAALNYLWSDDNSNGFLELSFESVLEKAGTADLWIGVANYSTLDQLVSVDERYALLSAYQNGQVFTYDARKGPTGGSEYLELGYLRPDLILADLIHIAHPDQSKSDTLFFHAKLQE